MASVARTYGRRDTILLAACVVLSLIALFLPERMRDPLATSLRRTILAPLVSLQSDAELSRRAWATREERVAARDSIALRAISVDALEAENSRLRNLLTLGARLRWGFVPAEVLSGRGVGEQYTVPLSAGSRSGVREFSPVVAPEGLVGVVKTADPTMSIAIIWSHPDFRVSAMAADGSAFGIVAAHLGDGPERYLLEMRGVPVRGTIAPGTEIVTSGLGGTFPRGIPIGIVMGEAQTSELWARTYLLRPAVLPSAISAVMVLTPARADSGVAGVWQTGQGMNGATRAIVEAGDSLGRAAALRLRAMAADSLARLRPAVDTTDSLGARPGADTLR